MILSYSLMSSVILAFGYLTYRLTMSGQRQHALNRQAILTLYGIALIAPLIMLVIILRHPDNNTGFGIEIGELTGALATTEVNNTDPEWNLSNTIPTILKIYVTGMVICAAYFIFGIMMLARVIRKGERTEFGTFTLIIVDDSCKTSPFSWGHSIVMTRRDHAEDGDMILLHEHAHLRHSHWTDLLLAYSTICLQWYNPAAWALREQLKAVHEYQADESVLETGTDAREYQMMLLKKAAGNGYQSLANSLNHSKLQKRVTMMYKKKTSAKRRLFALALVPAIGAGIALTAIPSVAAVLESIAVSSAAAVPTEAAMQNETSAKANEEKEVFTAVEHQAEFPGGMPALMQWLTKNIRYPEAAQKDSIQGRVIVKFVIEADGAITDPEIVRSVSPELDAETLRVVSAMPKWIPGKVNGQPVASYFTMPVNFRLTSDQKPHNLTTPQPQ